MSTLDSHPAIGRHARKLRALDYSTIDQVSLPRRDVDLARRDRLFEELQSLRSVRTRARIEELSRELDELLGRR